jgi:hypothetical protein
MGAKARAIFLSRLRAAFSLPKGQEIPSKIRIFEMLKLRSDWKKLLRYAWSIRLICLAGLLSGAEVALPLIQPLISIPAGVFAGLSALTVGGAFVARLVAQQQFSED